MKKLIFLLLLPVIFFSFRPPEDLKWYSLQEGLEMARRENKPVLLFVYVTWCDMCKRMDKKVFPSADVRSLISENFVLVKLNTEVDTVYLHSDKVLDRKLFLSEAGKGRFMLKVPTTVLYRASDNDHVTLQGLLDPTELKTALQKFLKK